MIILILLFITPVLFLIWQKNWKLYLLSFLPLVYVIIEVYLECKATDNHSEACVWGYLKYLYAIFIGSILYIIVTVFQIIKSYVNKKIKTDN